MAEFAIMAGGVVQDVIVADQSFVDQFHPGAIQVDALNPRPGIGWTFDGTTWTPAPPATPTNPVYSRTDFMKLFTDVELQTILNWDKSTTLSDAQKMVVSEFVEFFRDADTVNVSDATTTTGVNMLAAFGLLTTGRAAAILASRHA